MSTVLSQLASPVTTPLPAPLVLYRGHAVQDLTVVSFTHRGPLDERSAVLRLKRGSGGFDPLERSRAERWIGRVVEIDQPMTLQGDVVARLPLLRGRISGSTQELTGREDEIELTVECDWTKSLRNIQGQDARAISPTLQDAIAFLNLNIATHLLPPWVALRAVPPSQLRGSTLGDVLRNLCEHHGLFLRREMFLHGGNTLERRGVYTLAQGRPVRLGLDALANPAGAVRSLRAAVGVARSIQRIATAEPQGVESTFDLQPAWPDDETQQPDAAYAKTAAGFDAVSHVFRLWLLNEDGSLPGADAFDLSALFGESIEPRPLRFGATLTRDPAGRPLGFIVELSADGGATFTRYAGDVRIPADRAGVYLNDESLPAAFLNAARNGQVRLRITATLRSPLPIESVRWIGNPFADECETQVFDVRGAFAYRRVLPGSRYFASGMDADEADDRGRMAQWLAMQPVRRATHGRAVVVTVGIMPTLTIGDRLDQLAGRRITADLPDPAGAEPAAVLMNITHDYTKDESRLEWEV